MSMHKQRKSHQVFFLWSECLPNSPMDKCVSITNLALFDEWGQDTKVVDVALLKHMLAQPCVRQFVDIACTVHVDQ